LFSAWLAAVKMAASRWPRLGKHWSAGSAADGLVLREVVLV